MRIFDYEKLENVDDKENFNPTIKQYSPAKNNPKRRNTVLKEVTKMNILNNKSNRKMKIEDDDIEILFSSMEDKLKNERFGREM